MTLEIYLERLELNNFRDISGVFTLDPKTNEFRGMNGTGKTTLYDAETWLRKGKNSLGQADFDIKTIRDGKPLSRANHSVKGYYKVNGVPLVLERIYSEKWTKTRGQSAAEKDGHKTEYRIDENAGTLKKHFDQKVQEVFGGGEYLLCTDSSYFVGLHWQKRREILSSMVDKLDIEAVIDSIPGLRESLAGKTPDERKSIVSERQKAINKELEKIPALVTENKRTISISSKSSMSILHAQIGVEKAEESIKTSQKKIDNFKRMNADGNADDLKKLNVELRKTISSYENIKHNLQREVDENNRQKSKAGADIHNLTQDINFNKTRVKSLLDEFQKEKLSAYTHKPNSCRCCGEVFECPNCDEDKEDQEKLFNQLRSDSFKRINNDGVALEDKNKDLRIQIKNLESKKVELEKFVLNPCLKIDEDQETIDLKSKIQILENTANEDKEEMPESFNDELKETQRVLTQAQEDLAGLKATEISANRVKELESQQVEFSKEFDQIEQFLSLYDQYIQKVATETEGPISSLFGYVNFRMFNTQENGAVVPACDILNDEMKPYETAMSNGERVRAQLDFLYTFQNYFKIYGPVFVDNCESLTNPKQLDSQMIKLVHDEKVKKLTQI